MTKDSKSKGPMKAFTINLPDGVKKSLPKDFDLDDIGSIDLREAEIIANEDVLLDENDLIEDLEDFELQSAAEAKKTPGVTARVHDDIVREVREQVKEELKKEAVALLRHEQELYHETAIEQAEKTVPVEAILPAKKVDEDYDDGRTWISLHDIDSIDEHGRRWVPIEAISEDAAAQARDELTKGNEETKPERIPGERKREDRVEFKEEEPAHTLDELAGADSGIPEMHEEAESVAEDLARPIAEPEPGPLREPDKTTIIPEGHADENDEYMIWAMPDSDAVIAEPFQRKEEIVKAPDRSEKPDEIIGTKGGDKPAAETPRKETAGPVTPSRIQRAAARRAAAQAGDAMEAMTVAPGQVVFIDDLQVDRGREELAVTDEGRLEKIITGIMQVDEGASFLLHEANAAEDRDRIAPVSEELRPEYEEMFVDLEYKYGDEEMDYIHTAIVEEDYSDYIREIDEFFGTRGGRTVSARVELLGMTADEFDSIEDMLFKDEFKDIHLYDRYHLYEFDRAGREAGSPEDKQYRYLLPAEESLIDYERDSIESDVSASSALIFEEDVQHIKEQLQKRTGKTDREIVDLVERSFLDETAPAEPREEEPARELPGVETMPAREEIEEPLTAEEPAEAPPAAEDEIRDITDRVVILEDKADVDRFVKTFPEPKQMNIKMLLKYLDGLFEKLPEDIIRKFASSDYFNLYLKVLNELGV